MDAIDCALVDISDQNISLIDYQQLTIEQDIKHRLSSINEQTGLDTITRLDVILGRLFADAAGAICKNNQVDNNQICAIGCHGQTILHRATGPEPTSLQIGDANIIARETGIPTVSDFRRMDIAFGGQGAPFAPVIHEILFRQDNKETVVVNIGGMANITILPSRQSGKPVSGFDTGPGNVLLDEWTRLHNKQEYDRDGEWARSGELEEGLLQQMTSYPYFAELPPKSTGRDEFNIHWLDGQLEKYSGTTKNVNVQTTLVELTVQSIADMIRQHAEKAVDIILCGGGAHNHFLVERLSSHLQESELNSTGYFGYDPDAIESMCFAWLARLRLDNIPVPVSSVTGASRDAVLGAIYEPG